MAIGGLAGLFTAFAGIIISIISLMLGSAKKIKAPLSSTVFWVGNAATIFSFVALVFCCALLIFCFMTGDNSLQYVVQYRSGASGALGWLYRLSGLWAGREGSLLFWACVMSAFSAAIAVRGMRNPHRLDTIALCVLQAVLALFVGVLLFDKGNMPFVALPDQYLDTAGNVVGEATLWGMSPLLEHWAMAIHPPTLFIGYAGLAVPFAYALAALISNDSSSRWIEACSRATMTAWLFLGLGIGIGAVWAYVVLGWGGYWGWDPVENASLLPWLMGVALIHSFTVYRRRGASKRWSLACACATFSFVALGAFITRSGLVGSVHGFDGDFVSSALFLVLIVAPLLCGGIGLAVRWKSFADEKKGLIGESLLSKQAAYYMNNLFMTLAACFLAYMTISSALPPWLPFGGQALSAEVYNAVARPIGLLYFLVLAACPFLSWGRTQKVVFLKRARVPGIGAAILFACLVGYHFGFLLPGDADVSGLNDLSVEGPTWYDNIIAISGYLIASLLFFSALFMLVGGRAQSAEKDQRLLASKGIRFPKVPTSVFGGALAHMGMAIMLIGFIGSTMFVTEQTGLVGYDPHDDQVSEEFVIKDYTLKLTSDSVDVSPNETDLFNTLYFDVYKNDTLVGTAAPSIQVVGATGQQQLHAAVISFPLEDLFVVYRGLTEEGTFSLDVRVNPLIGFVWTGLVLLIAGSAVAVFGKRKKGVKEKGASKTEEEVADVNKSQP